MRGYKIFGKNYTCRGYQYALDDWWNVYDGTVEMYKSGFHFCIKSIDCLQYYDYSPENTYAEVECGTRYTVSRDKVVCNELKIKPLTYEEFGKLITFDVDTEFKKCSYVNGKLQGEYREMWDNGQLSTQATYVDGKLQGEYRGLYKDGKLHVQATYINGELDGEYREWWDNGQLCTESIYENCINISNKYWHRDGKLKQGDLFDALTIMSRETKDVKYKTDTVLYK